jgi:hypothetical protein
MILSHRCELASVLVLLPAALGAGPSCAADLPPPAELAAKVIVSGRTSTLGDVAIVRAGDHVPITYSGDRIKNTPGFSWWVSRHFALKTDYPEDRVRFYLALLELAYPHYVELFGAEPPDIERKRMAVVYASTADQLRKALLSDGIAWDFGGGGITYEGYFCAYQFPSGTLEYHQRYILLHECTHLFQMCLTGTSYNSPAWYREGVADSLGHHVYDKQRKQLTVHVLDKPTISNFLDDGLAYLKQHPELTFEKAQQQDGPERGVNLLMVHYLSDDPDRLQRFRLWRDELFRDKSHDFKTKSGPWLEKLFGPWNKLNADFAAWTAGRRNTFHYVDWGWEQDGNTLWSYGWPQRTPFARTNINLPPGEKPGYDALRMDYPAEPVSAAVQQGGPASTAAKPPSQFGLPLLGAVARGVDEPSVGFLLTFRRCPGRGVAGIALGVVDEPEQPGFVRVLIEDEQSLLIDGSDLGMARKSLPLPGPFLAAMAAGGHEVGITVKIAKKELQIVLKARDPQAGRTAEFAAATPVDELQRRRLLARPLAVLSRDGWHGITPLCDDARRTEPDLSVPAPANRWRNPGDKPLFGLYQAAWILGAKTPDSLLRLRQAMVAAADKDAAAQRQALAALAEGLGPVRRAVAECGATPEAVQLALAALAGSHAEVPPYSGSPRRPSEPGSRTKGNQH